jgi:acetyl-CoA C-acetyltransferase
MATTAHDPIVILSYARTPMGAFQGQLAGTPATELGSAAVRAAVERAGITGDQVDKIFMGCVLPAGLGQAPARQAALGAGLPRSVEATTINKVCGSGMQAAMFAHDMIAAGSADLIVAGGMESMSNSPYLMQKHRAGARIGHDTVYDHMMLDGLEDAYDRGRAMGTFAEDSAREYQFTRGHQDEYAIESLRRATEAIRSGASTARRRPSPSRPQGRGSRRLRRAARQGQSGEDPRPEARFRQGRHHHRGQRLVHLRRRRGLVLTRQSVADRLGVKPVARIVSHAAHAAEPSKFTTAPSPPSERRSTRPAGRSATSTCGKLTRPSPVSP